MVTDRYGRLMEALAGEGRGTMRCAGPSMLPVLANPSTCDYERADRYEVGDIVFCRVRGRFVDAHWVREVSEARGYLIGNNHGHLNGWTRKVFGRVVEARDAAGVTRYRRRAKRP